MVCWGGGRWPIAVQNPFQPWENARPLGGFWLRDGAVATSGGYQRSYAVSGSRHSHLIDPRTGRPADQVAAATVLAPDSLTANVLATTLCILTPEEGLRLIGQTSGAECLLVAAGGRQLHSPGLELLPVHPYLTALEAETGDEKNAKGDPWPEGFQMTVAIELPRLDGERRYRRPYVAVWIEDGSGRVVRTLTVWGNSPKWIRELSDWWKIGKGDANLVKAVTRATRGPGKYQLAWDGKDDRGKPVGQGTYTVRVEVHREHGKHVRQTGKIECQAQEAKLTLQKNEETGATQVEFGKKKP